MNDLKISRKNLKLCVDFIEEACYDENLLVNSIEIPGMLGLEFSFIDKDKQTVKVQCFSDLKNPTVTRTTTINRNELKEK